jgi:hypothetical protein
MKFVFILIIFIAFSFASCKKKEEQSKSQQSSVAATTSTSHGPPPCTSTVTEYISDYRVVLCKFKVGSYWVFQDSITNLIDTLLLQSENTTFIPGPQYSCKQTERSVLKMALKNEPEHVLKTMDYEVWPDGVVMESEYFWTSGSQPKPYLYTQYTNISQSVLIDSIFIYDRYYKQVRESIAYQFTQESKYASPVHMFPNSLKTYFNAEFGPLRFDLRDRITNQLTGRRKVISRFIVR